MPHLHILTLKHDDDAAIEEDEGGEGQADGHCIDQAQGILSEGAHPISAKAGTLRPLLHPHVLKHFVHLRRILSYQSHIFDEHSCGHNQSQYNPPSSS